MALPRESWIVLAVAGGALALVQTSRLWWRGAALRWRLGAQLARAQEGEAVAERLLRASGYTLLGRQPVRRWTVEVDGAPETLQLRADFLVEKGGRRYVAEVKTGSDAPAITSAPTRRQLLEYRCAFEVDGVLLIDAEARKVQTVRFPFVIAAPRPLAPLALLFLLGALVGAALAARAGLHW